MPRTNPQASRVDWDALYESAAPQAGYFTLSDAVSAGFSAPLLQYHCGSRVERVSRGIYRFRHYPLVQDDELVPIWLWTGKTGVFSHETALQLLGLSDVLPTTYHVTLPANWRARRLRTPAGVTLHFGNLGEGETTWHGPVPITAPLRTLQDCKAAHVQPDLVQTALQQALARGLVDETELRAIRSQDEHR